MKDGKIHLDSRVAKAFYGHFKELRQLQIESIPPLTAGENLVLSSGTGSGKTEAVVAPIVSRFIDDASLNQQVFILYIVPTKALANDLFARLGPPLLLLGLKIGIRHGDRDMVCHGKPPHLLITTPESLDVLLFRNDRCLDTVKAVIIDEAHLLHNTQRGLHLSILLNRLSKRVGHPLQWAILSATMGKPEAVRDFLISPNAPAKFLSETSLRAIDAIIRLDKENGNIISIVQKIFSTPHCKILIFANTRKQCEILVNILAQDEKLRNITFAHYSSLSPAIRVEVEKNFKQAEKAICVATSTLELGIDIGDIDCVLLYGAPRDVSSFLQRIGRGNRRKSKSNVVCHVPETCENPIMEVLIFHAQVELAKENSLPVNEMFELYGAAAQQMLSIVGAVEGQFHRVADLSEICSVHPHLSREKLESILSQLAVSEHLIAHGYKNSYGPGQKLFEIVDMRMSYGNFPISSQQIPVMFGKTVLASIPRINLLQLHSGDAIRLAGKKWHILKASAEGVEVESGSRDGRAKDIMYPGGVLNLDSMVLERLRKAIYEDTFDQNYYRPIEKTKLLAFVEPLRHASKLDSIPFTRMPVGFTYLTFAGERINRAIALISQEPDINITETTITSLSRIKWENIPDNPADYERHYPALFKPGAEQTFFQTLLPERLQRHEYVQSWLKDRSVAVHLARLRHSVPVEVDRQVIERFIT